MANMKSIEVGDPYDLQTGRLLGGCTCEAECGHCALCQYGDAVAGALREAGKRETQCHAIIEDQAKQIEDGRTIYNETLRQNADLRREVERLTEQLNSVTDNAIRLIDNACDKHAEEIRSMSLSEFSDALPRTCHWCDLAITADLRREVERLKHDSIVSAEMYEDAMDEVRALKEKLAEYLVAYRLEDKP